MLGERQGVIGVGANGENAAVNLGVEGLEPAVEHFGEARNFGNVSDGQSGLAQKPRRAAGGDDFRAERNQRAGKLNDSFFISDTNEDTHLPHDNMW